MCPVVSTFSSLVPSAFSTRATQWVIAIWELSRSGSSTLVLQEVVAVPCDQLRWQQSLWIFLLFCCFPPALCPHGWSETCVTSATSWEKKALKWLLRAKVWSPVFSVDVYCSICITLKTVGKHIAMIFLFLRFQKRNVVWICWSRTVPVQ